jgi:YfiH family protein
VSGRDFRFDRLDNGWRVGRFAALDSIAGVEATVTTADGPDVLAMRDDPDAAAAELEGTLGLSGVAWCEQVHGCEVIRVDSPGFAGRADGFVTDSSGLGLMVRSADCPLILAADRDGRAVGAAHASWRGTAGRIAQRLVSTMRGQFGVSPERLVACICPSAGACCYEVRHDFIQAMRDALGGEAGRYVVSARGKTFFDLWAANRDQLIAAGVTPGDVHAAGVCTICGCDILPSYRRQGAHAGRFAGVIAGRTAAQKV